MKRILTITAVITILLFGWHSFLITRAATSGSDALSMKFDFGGMGTSDGYIGVSAEETYSRSKKYGFLQPDVNMNVSAGGTGALSDAVQFGGSDGSFKVDLNPGVYKITVTTGNDTSTTIEAEGLLQLLFLTGNNAVDSFTIPVTDGSLEINATNGNGEVHSISTLEVEQISEGITTKPTIWLCGDSTVASYYNVAEDHKRGWGEYLSKYVDTDSYDIRNISISGIRTQRMVEKYFEVIEHYGKKGDILLLAHGINDYNDERKAHPDAIDPSKYIANMTSMIRRAKAKDVEIYLVKQQGLKSDINRYPLPKYKWFGNEIDKIAKSEKVNVIDLFNPWLEYNLENRNYDTTEYYTSDNLHPNAYGANKLARMVSDRLFHTSDQTDQDDDDDIDITPTVIYQTEESGVPVSNPHKGFVINAYSPDYVDSTGNYQYGIGGSAGNKAWDVCTIVSGELKWMDLNPKEGVYNWKQIDDMLDVCGKHGLTYGIRIIPYSSLTGTDDNYGKDHDFVPKWVYNKGAEKIRSSRDDDSGVFVDYPKWDDPVYMKACKDLAKALAKKYDGDPRVEYIDISIWGDKGEWDCSFVDNGYLPSLNNQKEMLDYYASVFDKTLLTLPTAGKGSIYKYALSKGIAKRDSSLICTPNAEWSLLPAYRSNLPVIGESYLPYSKMKGIKRKGEFDYINWTSRRFQETIEISHLSIFALNQDNHCGCEFYKENKAIVDKMCNRLGYNFTVTYAAGLDNRLLIKIKNTGLASCFFDIDLCAEIVDPDGNKIANFGKPVRIKKGSFKDNTQKTFVFDYEGSIPEGAAICLSMYESAKYKSTDDLIKSKDNPTVRFDNKNNLPNKRLKLVTKWAAPTATPTPTVTTTPTPTSTPTVKPHSKPSLTLDRKQISIVCGKSMILHATLTGDSGKITWRSSNPKTVTIDSKGKIVTKMAGHATITATAAGTSAKCDITVLYKDVTSVSDFWYAPTNYLTAKHVVKGYDNQTLFKPANKCTRAQTVTLIWRLMGEPKPKSKTCKFSDVKKTDYFYNACIWGNENHIVEGYKDGTFGPKIVCARRHTVTFLWRLAGKPESSGKKNIFFDVKPTDYYYKATVWASENQILKGYKDGSFRPNGDCLRRQTVTFLYKYDRFVKNNR